MSAKHIVPIIKVGDLATAIEFYCSVLGFRKEFEYAASPSGPRYAGLTLDGHLLHLSTFPGDGPMGTKTYIFVDDVDELYATFKKAGLAKAELEPTNQAWGQRELYVRDPDGNTLRFGSPTRADGSAERS
jgi:uncharacterized glyoxalase superfamily protein PhnB